MRPMFVVMLFVSGVTLATTSGLERGSDPTCTPAKEFAGIVLETGCMEEILDICDAYLNDEMHRLPDHQQNAVCMV